MIQPTPLQDGREAAVQNMYPTLVGRELQDAEENLARYFDIVVEIRQRVVAAALVDSSDPIPIIEERSNRSHKT